MAELIQANLPVSEIHQNNEEKKENILPVYTVFDCSSEGQEKTISKDSTDSQSKPKVVIHSECDRNLLLPLLTMETHGGPNADQPQHSKTHSKIPESPTRIMEASDIFLDPALYKNYSICTDIHDTFQERIAKQMEIIKDVTRERAVITISAGENAVLWLVNCFKYVTSGWLGLVIILFTIVAYGALGAVIFMMLESPYEEIYNMHIVDIRRELANKLENIARNETIIMRKSDFLALIQEDLIAYENNYLEYIKHLHNNDVTGVTWDFWNSFIFAGTIFTTIGYGHISPKTLSGRAATIIYSTIGIPLFLIVLTSFGKFLTRIIKFFWAYIFCSKRGLNAARIAPLQNVQKKTEAVNGHSLEDKKEIGSHIERKTETKADTPTPSLIEIDEEFNLPISLAFSILIIYMICGAIAIHMLESWTYFDSFYCVFISMSTIGLGDLVISNSMYMIYSILYIIMGLSLTAMCIDVVQQKLTVMFKDACEKVLMLVEDTNSSLELSVSKL